MKICVVQSKAIKGNLHVNLHKHVKFIDAAVAKNVDVIIFPELSLTGYEPGLARQSALQPHDERLAVLQTLSDAHNVIIGVGAPLQMANEVCISMLLFHPNEGRQVYYKQYLHADEEPFFVAVKNESILIRHTTIAIAICYELSVEAHALKAFENKAQLYVASVAKSATGVAKAYATLSETASKYNTQVLMSNCVGYCDNFFSCGNSAVWNSSGQLLESLDEEHEGFLIFDTITLETTKQIF